MDGICEDALRDILSFLSPQDIASCALVCRSFSRVIYPISSEGDADLWRHLCERRWGAHTRICRWNCSSYRSLYKLLWRWERLIGFWRGIVRNLLVTFEWRPDSIQGFCVLPASVGSLDVRKIPFLWLGTSAGGEELCLLHHPSVSAAGNVHCPRPTLTPRFEDFADVDPEWSSTKLAALDLVPVMLKLSGADHFVLEEQKPVTSMVLSKNLSLAEAAASASFGAMPEASSTCGSSPPGSFRYEMYQFLTGKVTSPGSDRAARKQRFRDRLRAESQGRKPVEQEHFLKVVNVNPTSDRPLQGLWKGLCHCMGLRFILLSYSESGNITCRTVGNFASGRNSSSSSSTSSVPVQWTCKFPPSTTDEEHARLVSIEDHVVEMLSSSEFRLGSSSKFSGKVWIYNSSRSSSSSSSLGLLDFTTDFRLICSRDNSGLCDLVS